MYHFDTISQGYKLHNLSVTLSLKTVYDVPFQEVLPSGEEPRKNKGPEGGLNVISAAIFVAGEMAGSGILAIPKAVVDCG